MADVGLSKIIGLKTDQNIGKRQWGWPRNTGEKGVIIGGVPHQHACPITLKERISSTYLAHSLSTFFFFLMWTIFKVFTEFLSILLQVLVFWPQGKWDLSSPARDRTGNPGIGRQNLNHGSTREVPLCPLLLMSLGFQSFFLPSFQSSRDVIAESLAFLIIYTVCFI